MKIFFDTEFTGLHQNTTLISIGLVAENERKFYAEFTDYNRDHVDPWLQKNVIDKLVLPAEEIGLIEADDISASRQRAGKGDFKVWVTRHKDQTIKVRGDSPLIADHLADWLNSFGEPIRIWSDCLAYDWVLFLNLWGGAGGEPKCVYYIPFDICTLFEMCSLDPDVNREEFAYSGREVEAQKHNALWDAKTIKACYEILKDIRLQKECEYERGEMPSRSITEAAKKVGVFYKELIKNNIPGDLAAELTAMNFNDMFLTRGAFFKGGEGE